jgi:outer membrane protein assembly factor BamB
MAARSKLYIGTGRYVAAIDSQTGEECWRTRLPHGGGNIVTTLIAGERLFVGHWGYAYCLSRRDGTIVWENGLPRMGYGPVMLVGDFAAARQPMLFVGTSRFVAALDPHAGDEVWRAKLPHGGHPIISLTLRRNSLFVGHRGYVYRFDKRNGTLLWENGLPRMGYLPVIAVMEGAESSSPAAVAGGLRAEQQRRAAAAS